MNGEERKELDRIRKVYERRRRLDRERYSLFVPGEHYMEVSFERALLRALGKTGLKDLSGLKILEIGCGDGRRLRSLQRIGAEPSNEYGIELLDFFVEEARRLSGNCGIIQGNAAELPYGDCFFDVVLQRTVFTSVIDEGLKEKMASEMLRVLAPGGIIIWYDFFVNNPSNPDVRRIGRDEIRRLFGGCDIRLERTTLAPPLARLMAPYSTMLCQTLEKIPLLRTHYLGVIRKPPE